MEFFITDFLSLLTGLLLVSCLKQWLNIIFRQNGYSRWQWELPKRKTLPLMLPFNRSTSTQVNLFVGLLLHLLCLEQSSPTIHHHIPSDGCPTVVEHESTVYKPWTCSVYSTENVRTYTPVEGYLYTEESRANHVTVGFYWHCRQRKIMAECKHQYIILKRICIFILGVVIGFAGGFKYHQVKVQHRVHDRLLKQAEKPLFKRQRNKAPDQEMKLSLKRKRESPDEISFGLCC